MSPLSTFVEPKLLDQLFGVCIGQVNQAISAGTAAQTTLTVMGSVGSGSMDVTAVAGDQILAVTPGTTPNFNLYTNADVFTVTSATATQLTFASRTVVATRAVGDYLFRIGNTTTGFERFLYHNRVYVGLSTAGAQTTVTAGSDGLAATGTINVASTTGFPNSTQIVLIDTTTGLQTVQYTGASGTTLTGCTTGGTGVMKTNDVVMLVPTSTAILAAEPTSTGGYARVSVINNAANFSAATLPAGTSPPAVKVNAAAITFPASSAAWSTGATVLDAFFIADALTLGGGNVLAWGYLTTAQAVNASGITPSFASSALLATLL